MTTQGKLGHHDFRTQLANGKRGEIDLDAFFARWFVIRPATQAEERAGIDRHFTDKVLGVEMTVQYKRDARAEGTGRLFIEMVHAGPAYLAPGWAYSCTARYIMLYVPGWQTVLCVKLSELRKHVDTWLGRYPKVAARNDGYWTYGVAVPREAIDAIALRVYDTAQPEMYQQRVFDAAS